MPGVNQGGHEEQFRILLGELDALRRSLDRLSKNFPGDRAAEPTASESRRLLDEGRAHAQSARSLVKALGSEIASLRDELQQATREAWDNKARRADATARLRQRDKLIKQIETSSIWKLVKPLWKLQTRGRENKIEEPERPQLLSSVELPRQWTTSRDVLLIKGWCFASGGGQVAGVRVKVGRKGQIARYGLERPDVVESIGHWPASLHSGFTAEIRVPKGTTEVQVEAIVQGGDWQPFFSQKLVRDSAASGDNEDEWAATDAPGTYMPQKRLPWFPGITVDKAVGFLTSLLKQHSNRSTDDDPFFSIITATYNTDPQWFTEAAASLLRQSFTDWEWCIVDDGSTSAATRELLSRLADVSGRLRIKFSSNGGISSATNQALALAKGEFVCFLDHDDLLDADALETMAEKIRDNFDVIYSDEDKLDGLTGELVEHFFKPEWSPEYFRGAMYVGHLLCVRRELASAIGFKAEFDGVQDFEFMLRLSETGAKIGHVPKVAYHWRKTAGSVAANPDAKPEIGVKQQQAVNAHLRRLNLPARAEPHALPHRLRIVPAPRERWPKVSVIIPTRDAPELLSRCLDSLHNTTSYGDFEVVIVDNETTDREALEVMERHPIARIAFPSPFNFSKAMNLGAERATGEFVVFLNNDTEIVTPNWLEQLVYYAEQPDVGAAGAVLLYADQTVQHAGVVLGIRGTADHVMRGFPVAVDGYAGSLSCAREVTAVTGACMMLRKRLFEEVGGFNPHFFTAYQDVDLCLRLRERGLRNICTPEAIVLHHESASRKTYYDMVDRMLLLDQWENVIEAGDPYYNRNLHLERGDYSLARTA